MVFVVVKGGYFIVNGTDKVVVHQEYRRVNVVSVTDNSAVGGRLGKIAAFTNDVVDETKADESFESAAGEADDDTETKKKDEDESKKKKTTTPKADKTTKKNERKRNLHAR